MNILWKEIINMNSNSRDHTDGWSTCSYLDFIAFIKSPNFCLSPINKNTDEYYEEERRPRKRFMQRF